MYIGFLQDRIELGFKANKDFTEIKISLHFKKIFNNSTHWIIIRSQEIFILIFSKKALVGFVLFFRSQSIPETSNLLSVSSSQSFQSSIIKLNKSEFLSNPLPVTISDIISSLKGGADHVNEFNNITAEEKRRLLNSILSKVSDEYHERISFGKILKNIYGFIKPIVDDPLFLIIVKELNNPFEPTVRVPNDLKSADILGSSRNGNLKNNENSNPSSSIFAEALPLPNYKRNYQIQRKLQLNMIDENLQNYQKVEELTKLLRQMPHLPSKSLGENHYSGLEQLKKKAVYHLPKDYDFEVGNVIVGKQALKDDELINQGLAESKAKGTMFNNNSVIINEQQKIDGFLDVETRLFTAFEQKPFYEKQDFISSYQLNPAAADKFRDLGKVGLSKAAKKKIKQEFYNKLPQNAHANNEQIREVNDLETQSNKTNSDVQLTDKQKALKERVDRNLWYKKKFYQEHPNFPEDEL